MRGSCSLLLLVILHALQSEGKNRLCSDRGKRRIRADLIENVILPDVIKQELQNSFYKPEQLTKCNFYESILKNIVDLVELKKNEIKDNIFPNQEDAMFQSSGDCRESYDKPVDNDPSMTKYYTFSKTSAEEQKTLPWLDLLSSPFVHSLVKPKPAVYHQRKNVFYPNYNKLHAAETKNHDSEVKRKELDADSLNNIVKLFSSLGYGQSKRPTGHESEIGLTNQLSSSNEILDDKLASSCLVENKSNFFKTDASSPYNKFIGINCPESLGLDNYTNYLGRFHKDNTSDKYAYFNEGRPKQRPNHLSDQLRNFFTFGEYKASRWPEPKLNPTEPLQADTNFTKAFPQLDRKVSFEKEISDVNANNAKTFIDVLSDISLDPPQNKYLQDFTGRFNATKYLNELLAQEIDFGSTVPNENIKNAMQLKKIDSKPNPDLQNLIQGPNTLERIRVLNNIFSTSKIEETDSKPVFPIDSRVSTMTKNTLEPKFNDHTCDIKTLTKILNYKMNPFDERFGNTTTTEAQVVGKWNQSISYSNAVENVLNPVTEENTMPPPSIAIGEQDVPAPLDIRPGHEKITLPEYEKMDNMPRDFTKIPERIGVTDYRYEIPATATIENIQSPSTESPPSLGADTLNALHRNMIPVIDFLGQMWNSPNRRNHISGVTSVSRSLASDCGGYVIVPLPKHAMFQAWKRLEKTGTLSKDPSNTMTGVSNVSALVNPSNRDLLEKFVLRRLYDSFRGYLTPRRRSRRSQEIIEDSHTDVSSTTPNSPLNSTQLPPTDKWIISSSPESFH